MTDMLEVGGRAGRLDTVMQALSGYYERQERLMTGLRAAVIYPAVLLLMLLFVFFVLITRVLPVFSEVLSQLGGSLSGLALLSLRFGVWLTGHWAPVAAVLIVLAAAAVLLWKSGRTRAFLESCGLFRRLSASVAAARFAEAMSLTMKSGLDADESMEMARRLAGNTAMRKKLTAGSKRLAAGESFAEVLLEENVFPALYCRMLAVGFKTGAADTAMAEIARRASEKVQSDVERMAGRVEPGLVILMSLLVGLILLSVMLPLLGVMSGLG
jgi:type IV pilus assembly protein PilC